MVEDFSVGWVDAVLAVVLLLSTAVGFVRGLVFEVMSVFGWLVAYFVAHWYAPEVAPYLPIGNPGGALNHLAALVLTFLGVLLAWALTARLIRLLIRATPLSVIDRFLGGIFGLVRGMIVLLVVATAVTMTPWKNSPAWQESRSAPLLEHALGGLVPLLPPEVSRYLTLLIESASQPLGSGDTRSAQCLSRFESRMNLCAASSA